MTSPDYAQIRLGYRAEPLLEGNLAPTPLAQFEAWFADALTADIIEPNAMTLATIDPAGNAAARTVLLKGLDARGFQFATNYASAKAADIAAHPSVALVFTWLPLSRQVCIRGVAAKAPREESAAYFATRPRGHQLGAWASQQSQVIANREVLQDNYARVDAQFAQDVPLPENWGIFIVRPETVEFWQGQESRMHDRLRYRRIADLGLDDSRAWTIERLAP